MYLEFIFLLFDYFKTLKFKFLAFEILLPALLAFVIYHFTKDKEIIVISSALSTNSLSLLAILIGFSITVVATLASSGSKNIDEMKLKMTKYVIGGHQISLFQLVLINLSYSIVMEALCLMWNLCLPLVWTDYGIYTIKFLFCLDIFFLLHIILLNIRNITDFYFVLFKKEAA